MNADILVIGGGIAGLSAAWRLHQAGRDVQLLEADDAPGGNIRTTVQDGFRLEKGPHNFMASAEDVWALIEEVGALDQVVQTRAAAANRFIVRDGKMRLVPSGLWSAITTPLLSFGSKLTLATEPFRTARGEPTDTAQQFFERRFGKEAARILAGGFINGVYAGDPAILSAPAAFPLFWGFEQETGSMVRGMMKLMKQRKAARAALGDAAPPKRSGLYSLQQGLGQLTNTVAQKLGERCRLGHAVTGLQHNGAGWTVRVGDQSFSARRLVLAVPPPQAARLLGPLDARAAELLEGIPMAQVASVQLGYRQRRAEIPDGYGFLAPRGEGVRTLGILFPSRLFEGRTPGEGDLLAAFTGGMLDPGALALGDAELERFVRADVEKLMGFDVQPDLVRVARYADAIPQLVLGHLERVAELRERCRVLGELQLAGNYLHGVGLKDAVRAGFEAAAALLQPPTTVAPGDHAPARATAAEAHT